MTPDRPVLMVHTPRRRPPPLLVGRFKPPLPTAAVFAVLVLSSSAGCRALDAILLSLPEQPGVALPEQPGVALPDLESLTIEPSNVRLVDDGVSPGETQQFRVTGSFAEGNRDVTTEVVWSIEDSTFGSVEGGTFTSVGVGGRTFVVATSGTRIVRAEVQVALDVVVIQDDVPADAPSIFTSSTSSVATDRALEILYPSTETMFPPNLSSVRHEWHASTELDLFVVAFDSPLARIRIYTRERAFTADGTAWRWLARTHAGSSVDMTVRGVSSASPDLVRASPTITLRYARGEVPGAIYFWSTTARGIMRATLDAPLATKFFPASSEGEGGCVGCHSLSRDGRRMAIADDDGRLDVISMEQRESIYQRGGSSSEVEERPKFGFGTFDPRGERLMIASEGELELFDVERQTEGDVSLPAGCEANHPDWSPDGQGVAIAYLCSPSDETDHGDVEDQIVRGTSLARLPVLPDGSFGEPIILVQSTGPNDTIAFPVHSPDGRLIAFARMVGSSKDNSTATLHVVRADGSGAPIALGRVNLNRGRAGDRAFGSTMPTWAPSSRPEIAWLAFSSDRPTGAVTGEGIPDQIWMAAIDPNLAIPGEDPSYAAFWLPFQSARDSNHGALWSGESTDVCPSTVDICGNGLDDDCSGAADDACCTPTPEVCGNLADDDCDGEADEGCGCELIERCDNGIDDDCDRKTDDDDDDCDD